MLEYKLNSHWKALDGLRGLLSLFVVFLHFGVNNFLSRTFHAAPIPFGLAVDVFFLLSGYVLTHSVRNGVNPAAFAGKRIFRLLPVYYTTTVILLFATSLLPNNIWADAFVAGPFFGRDPINYPAWSVVWELYIPILVVFIPLPVPRRLAPFALFIVSILLGACDIQVAYGEQSLYFPRAACGLAAGHLLYRSGLSTPIRFDYAAAGVIGCILLAGAEPPLAFLLPFLTMLAIPSGTHGQSFFNCLPAQWLGHISFTLYLVHIPVLRVMSAIWGHAIDTNSIAKLAGILASFVAAVIITVTIERPAMAISARLFKTTVQPNTLPNSKEAEI